MTDTAFWDKAAPKYAKDPISDMPAYEATLGRMRHYLEPDHKVLEIGCGTGSTALELAPGVAEYTATDVSAGMIEIAKNKITGDLPATLNFQVSAAGTLPEGHFDAILALNLFHLVRDLEDVLQSIYERLPSGGLLIDKTALLKDGKWYIGAMLPVMQFFGKAPYCRSMTADDYRSLLRRAGFEPVEEIIQPGLAPRMFTVSRKP